LERLQGSERSTGEKIIIIHPALRCSATRISKLTASLATAACWVLLIVSPGVSFADSGAAVLSPITVDFELLNRDDSIVHYADFRGENVLLAFGFTHCLHICPMIAANMASTLKLTDKEATGIFVSVDTERDTPLITDNYARGYGNKMVGLSGTFEQVSKAARNFNATYVVTKSEHNYTVQHTPSIFLIGPGGAIIDVFAMTDAPRKIADAMK